MRVKKFEAKNMKDALQMVKNELGPDAVILSARDNRKSYGIAGETSVEITAAVSESTLQKKKFVESRMTAGTKAKFHNSDAKTQRQIIERMVENRIRENEAARVREAAPQAAGAPRPITSTSYIDIQDEEIEAGSRRSAAFEKARGRQVRELLNDFDQDFSRSEERRATPKAPRSQATAANESAMARVKSAVRDAWKANAFIEDEGPSAEALASIDAKATAPATYNRAAAPAKPGTLASRIEAARGGLETIPEAAPQAVSQGGAAIHQRDSEIATLKSEVQRLQSELQRTLEGFQKVPQSFVNMHPGAEYGISYDLSFMFQKLVESGVSVENSVEILREAAKSIDPMQQKKRPIIEGWVARWLLNSIQINANPFQGRVHVFVGGAGSGKTSTLVKMASQLVVKEKKKIAVLTTDAFKVGAVDQLKIYCQILNVPFAVIRSRKDWEWVMGQLQNVDHVLVDSPGLQLNDLDEIQAFKSLMAPEEIAASVHLCVSATAKDGDAFETARRYKVTDYHDLIVTNLDQSVQHGIIYNLQRKTGKPLHSFGIGVRIPEDFELASKERVLDLIFKLTKLRRETK